MSPLESREAKKVQSREHRRPCESTQRAAMEGQPTRRALNGKHADSTGAATDRRTWKSTRRRRHGSACRQCPGREVLQVRPERPLILKPGTEYTEKAAGDGADVALNEKCFRCDQSGHWSRDLQRGSLRQAAGDGAGSLQVPWAAANENVAPITMAYIVGQPGAAQRPAALPRHGTAAERGGCRHSCGTDDCTR